MYHVGKSVDCGVITLSSSLVNVKLLNWKISIPLRENTKKKWINIIQGKNIQRNRFDFIIDTRKKGHLMFYYLFFPGEVVILLHLY